MYSLVTSIYTKNNNEKGIKPLFVTDVSLNLPHQMHVT